MKSSRNEDKALATFQRHGGVMRTSQALALGIHAATLYGLRDSGKLWVLSRGLFTVANSKQPPDMDMAIVASRVPGGAICLISALAFHGITTQVPAAIYLALPRGSYYRFKIQSPPISVFRFDAKSFKAGLETKRVGSTNVNIYNVSRTVVDCFKFRNKIGLDVALEALRLARERKRVSNRELLHYARLLRMERVMQPYLYTP